MIFDTDIPVCAPVYASYPFARLQPGESVMYPCSDSYSRDRARKGAYRVAGYRKWKITVRSLPEGVRVWRHS
jgi:hypothetical protein